jgi:aldose 1-epimerase
VSAPTTITIRSGDTQADIAPDDGGRLAQLTVTGTALLVGWSPGAEPTGWGAYPMVPWAGRIRHGRFSFDGIEHQLPINFGDHAIHGVGFSSAWTVEEHAARTVSLRLVLPTDERWPFGGMCEQQFTADDGALTMTISVTATDRAFPFSFGWHPWFRKPTALAFHPSAMYRRDDEVAVAELVPVPEGPWDDCFVNTEPVQVEIDGVSLRLTSDCDHWVVYDERAYATCIEPQTGPPDAFNIAVRTLEPGESANAWYRIEPIG